MSEELETYLDWPQAKVYLGNVSRTTVWRNPEFYPQQVRVSPGRKAWQLSDLLRWQERVHGAQAVNPKPAIGRPRQSGTVGPRGGKGFTMTARITAETRAALEAEAERTGRSIGQVAELWIEKGRFWAALEKKVLGE